MPFRLSRMRRASFHELPLAVVTVVALQNEEHYYFLSLAREADRTDVRLEKPARKRSNL